MRHAHHAAYFAWFEAGRSDLLRDAGRSYASVEEGGLLLPVVEAQARYHRPARYDELLRLETSVDELRRAQVTFAYRLVREGSDELLATGRTRHAALDDRRKPCRIPDWLRDLLAN